MAPYLDSLVVGPSGQRSWMYLSFAATGHCSSRLHSLIQKEAVGISSTSGKHLGLRLERTSSLFGAIVGMPGRLVLQRPFSAPIVGFLEKRMTKNHFLAHFFVYVCWILEFPNAVFKINEISI